MIVVQLLNCVHLFATPWAAARQAPCPSPPPRACSNSCPLSQWCRPTISSSVAPYSSCLQSFPASGSFPVSQLFSSGGQSTGASASVSVLPMNIQDWFPLGWTCLISLLSKELSKVFPRTTVQRHQFFGAQPSIWSSSKTDNFLNYYHYTLYLFSRGNEEAWKGRCVDLAHLTSVSVLTSFWHKTWQWYG